MYTVHHRIRRHYVRYLAVVLVLGVVGGGVLAVKTALRPQTLLTQSPAVTHHVGVSQQPSQHITKGILALDLPASWVETAPPNTPYTIYSWRGAANSDDAARRLDIYLDTLPADLAVNRLLPVQGNGDHMDVIGVTSDNCVNFTDKTPDSAKSGKAQSKWGGVNFWCDTGNYERDVVATGSTEGINVVTLTGSTKGVHRVLLLYTDNSANFDYGIFVTIAKSLIVI